MDGMGSGCRSGRSRCRRRERCRRRGRRWPRECASSTCRRQALGQDQVRHRPALAVADAELAPAPHCRRSGRTGRRSESFEAELTGRAAARSAIVASWPSRFETGSPTKRNIEKAMRATAQHDHGSPGRDTLDDVSDHGGRNRGAEVGKGSMQQGPLPSPEGGRAVSSGRSGAGEAEQLEPVRPASGCTGTSMPPRDGVADRLQVERDVDGRVAQLLLDVGELRIAAGRCPAWSCSAMHAAVERRVGDSGCRSRCRCSRCACGRGRSGYIPRHRSGCPSPRGRNPAHSRCSSGKCCAAGLARRDWHGCRSGRAWPTTAWQMFSSET